MRLLRQSPFLMGLWLLLLGAGGVAIFRGNYSVAFAAAATILITLLPIYSQRLLRVRLPSGFLAAIALFLAATVFLGEVGDFYERFWWWDVVLHIGSAIGFGLIGVVLMLILVRGDKLRAAPVTVAFFAFCFAIMIGAVREIWEFTLDQTLGLNTQKSGLVDTMWDLIVDCLGAAIGVAAGYVYLKGLKGWVLTATLRDFVDKNARLFKP